MATHCSPGESIECNKSTVAARKIVEHVYVKLHNLRGEEVTFFKYKTKIRAIVTIEEELDPRVCIMREASFLDLNDALEANVIEIYVPNKVKFQVSSNFSNVHGIQWNSVKGFTYAMIVIPWRSVLEQRIAV